MALLLVASRYDYGQPQRGFSFEYLHLYQSMLDAGYSVDLFDFPTVEAQHGRRIMNELLRTQFLLNDYQAVLYVPYQGNEIQKESWGFRSPETVLVLWMFNDDWRYESYTRTACWDFDAVVSDVPGAEHLYGRDLGYDGRVFYMPRACRPSWFSSDIPLASRPVDVTFLGQIYGDREDLLRRMIASLPDGTRVAVSGVTTGRTDWWTYAQIMNQSKIVYCPAHASQGTAYQSKARFSEALAAGAVLVTDHPQGAYLCDPDAHSGPFAVYAETPEQVGEVLRHLDRYVEMARLGTAEVLQRRRYVDRIGTVLAEMGVSCG